MSKFRLNEEHIVLTIKQRGHVPTDALCDSVFGRLNVSAVEKMAQQGQCQTSQVALAQREIWNQVHHHPEFQRKAA